MWDLEMSSWDIRRAFGDVDVVPDAIRDIAVAETDAAAESAYQRLDNFVVVQGLLFEAAVPTTRCLVGALPHCSDAARPRILELLAHLGGGDPGPQETARGPENLRAQCIGELRLGFAYFVAWLERGTEMEREWCADLLGLCALEDRSLLERVRFYLQRAKREALGTNLEKIIESWLTDWLI